MKFLAALLALLLVGPAAYATNVTLTLGGGSICAGSVADTGVLTITSCTIPVASVTGGAPLASPVFTGTPTVPGYAPLASPVFTGTPTVPGYAPLASPALTGTPTAPTAAGGTNTTQVATTAFTQAAVTASFPSAYPVVTTVSLPAVTTANTGALAYATDCRNTGQGAGTGTGCLVAVDRTGIWAAVWSGLAVTH
jgi:hypothetical protein